MHAVSFLAFFLLFSLTTVQAFDSRLLANNKESFSRQISKRNINAAEDWARSSGLPEQIFKRKAATILKEALFRFGQRNASCDLGLATILKEEAIRD